VPFAVEFSAKSERDFELIFDHLFESYIGFGESSEEALERGARRCSSRRSISRHRPRHMLVRLLRDDEPS
jgi:hypothetical protein